MARFLFATMPIPGHVNPFTPVARTLVQRGHEVVWYGSRHFQTKIEATGARFSPIKSMVDYGDSDYNQHFPERRGREGLNLIVFDFEKLFLGPVEGMFRDLSELVEETKPDILLADPAVAAAGLLDELKRVTTATLNISVFSLPLPDMPPFGLGMPFNNTALGRARNALMRTVTRRIIFRNINRQYAALRRSLALPLAPFEPTSNRNLYLQPSVPAVEYPVKQVVPQVHFVGALLPDAPPDFTPPAWWDEVVNAEKPIVHVTQGTIATETGQLIEPVIRAFANEDVLLVVTTGGAPVDSIKINPLPANVRVERFIPHVHLLPHVDVLVTNGGFGGVMQALAHGIPLVVAGTTEDKPEVAARIAHRGLGINLKTATPTEEQLCTALRQITSDPTYRQRAQVVQAEIAAHGGANRAAELLERLAQTRQPVTQVN